MCFSIFSTRLECVFQSSPLVSSVGYLLPSSLTEKEVNANTRVKKTHRLDITKRRERSLREKMISRDRMTNSTKDTISGGNLQSYWTTTTLWKPTVVLDYYDAMETYSRIGLLRGYGNLQSYWTTTKLWQLPVLLDYYEAMETYSRIGLLRS